MSYETLHSDDTGRIGPQLSLADVDVPPAVGEQFATLYGTSEPPANAADWALAMRAVIETEREREPTVDDLCTATDGDHAFESADAVEPVSQSYLCVLDPLIYPFLTGTPGAVTSTTPVRGATVAFDVREDGFDVSHDDAVVSVGLSNDVGHVDDVSVETVYRQVCGYVRTFEDEAEYETWRADAGGVTTPLSAAEGLAVARELASVLFDADDP